MSLDDRLRSDLREIAADVDPSVETALRAVFEARDHGSRTRATLPRVLAAAAACLALVGGLLAWWLTGARSDNDDVVIEPPPSGTYESTLTGDLAGLWRLRFGSGQMSLVAPDTRALGSRATGAPYRVAGRTLTTELLAERCGGPGSYTWDDDQQLQLRVEDDTCDLRVRLLTAQKWVPVTGSRLVPGTYGTPPLSRERLRRAALAEGFRPADVDAYLTDQFPGVRNVRWYVETQNGAWTAYSTADGGAPTGQWSGVYDLPDTATIVADGELCRPLTYDYRLSGDTVRFVLVDDPCTKREDVGELIAQTVIYESAPFQRLK